MTQGQSKQFKIPAHLVCVIDLFVGFQRYMCYHSESNNNQVNVSCIENPAVDMLHPAMDMQPPKNIYIYAPRAYFSHYSFV